MRANDVYTYERSDGRLTLASHDSLLARKAAYRERHRKQLAAKQADYRRRMKTMIKHGKIHKLFGRAKANTHSHLDPIKKFVTKGITDAKEPIVLQPMACDVRGARRFDGQQCVIAKALTRIHKPQAVAVGRSFAYAVFDGLAVRFQVPIASRRLIEEFDSSGRVRKAPIELRAVHPSLRLRLKRQSPDKRKRDLEAEPKRKRARRYGVRAIGGGIAA